MYIGGLQPNTGASSHLLYRAVYICKHALDAMEKRYEMNEHYELNCTNLPILRSIIEVVMGVMVASLVYTGTQPLLHSTMSYNEIL